MNRIKRLLGILSIAASAMLLGAAAAAVIFCGFSPLNAFYNELGLFSSGYFVLSFALLFNLSLVLFGLVFGALMVIDALAEDTLQSTILGFFGALTGVLAAAQGIFTLNISQYHYIVSSAFYISAFVMCALYVIFKLLGSGRKPIVSIIVAACAGVSGAVYAWYMLSGGMSRFFIEDASMTSRAGLMPYALVGWAAIALLLAFTVLYSITLLGGRSKAVDVSINDVADHNDF